MDLANTIAPKSDQLNADDLLAGPRTIRITRVEAGSAEQPVFIHYHGGDGRPYKPGKSMRRVLVALWGSKAEAYIGRSLTLYCDPAVKFGGDAVGGIRISHASDIPAPVSLNLTVTRGKRKPFVVQPLATEPAIDVAALTEAGSKAADEGSESLRSWWATLTKDAQRALKPRLDSEWKTTAANADALKA